MSFIQLPLLIAALTSLTTAAPLRTLFRRSEAGPVIASNFPDPAVINVGPTWYAFATNNGNMNIPMASSPDFKSWSLLNKDALPTAPSWVNMTAENVWAPDVVQLDDGSFVLYFSATSIQDSAKHCVGAATSKTVTGPYTPLDQPMFCPLAQGGAIDASGFKDWSTKGNWDWDGVNWANRSAEWNGHWKRDDTNAPNCWENDKNPQWWGGGSGGQRYVVYKIDGAANGHGGQCGNSVPPIQPTPLILQPVEADGTTLTGSATTLLDNNGISDEGVTEAPSLVKTPGGKYVLFFSSNCYNGGSYTVNYATSDAVTGPYTRYGPLFVTGDYGLYSPGGADVNWDGHHMLFHADYPNHNADSRALYTAVIDIEGNTVTA